MEKQALELIKAGNVGAFNDLRVEHGKDSWNFSNQDFSNLQLNNIYLVHCDLSNCKFHKTNLHEALFCRSILDNAEFELADLGNASFGPPQLINATLMFSDMGSHLNYGANMDNAKFFACDMRGANMRETTMSNTNFGSSKLEGANFKRSNKEDAIFDLWDGLPHKSKAQKYSYFKNILLIALADGEINTQERVFLEHLAKKLDLSDDDHKYVLENINSINFVVPQEREELIQQFRDILMIMVIDLTFRTPTSQK